VIASNTNSEACFMRTVSPRGSRRDKFQRRRQRDGDAARITPASSVETE